jgi:hypothetical protein
MLAGIDTSRSPRSSHGGGRDELQHLLRVGHHGHVVGQDLHRGGTHARGELPLGVGRDRLVAVGDEEPGRQRLPGTLRQLSELHLQGLNDTDARAVLQTALRGPLDRAVLDEIVAEARGNPLALVELPRGRTQAEIAFGFALPSVLPLISRAELAFLRQLQPLPAETRRLLLVAAVEPVGDAILVCGVPQGDSGSARTRRLRARPPD